MEHTSAVPSRRLMGFVAACWLGAVAVVGWLNVAGIGGSRAILAISTCLLAPLMYRWPVPWDGLHAEWLVTFVMAMLSVALLWAYAIRQNRATAVLSMAGIAWWCWLAAAALSS